MEENTLWVEQLDNLNYFLRKKMELALVAITNLSMLVIVKLYVNDSVSAANIFKLEKLRLQRIISAYFLENKSNGIKFITLHVCEMDENGR